MKNYSDTIKSKKERILTAKGNKFIWRCVDIIAQSKGLHKYSPQMKETKERFFNVVEYLLIDKEMSTTEVAELIKSSRFLETNNLNLLS